MSPPDIPALSSTELRVSICNVPHTKSRLLVNKAALESCWRWPWVSGRIPPPPLIDGAAYTGTGPWLMLLYLASTPSTFQGMLLWEGDGGELTLGPAISSKRTTVGLSNLADIREILHFLTHVLFSSSPTTTAIKERQLPFKHPSSMVQSFNLGR